MRHFAIQEAQEEFSSCASRFFFLRLPFPNRFVKEKYTFISKKIANHFVNSKATYIFAKSTYHNIAIGGALFYTLTIRFCHHTSLTIGRCACTALIHTQKNLALSLQGEYALLKVIINTSL